MRIEQIIWDLDNDPDGNVQHIAEHGITLEEVEQVLRGADEVLASYSSGLPIVFGITSAARHLAVVFEIVSEVPLVVYPITAYETEP